MTDQELRDLVGALATNTERMRQEADERQRQADERQRQADERQRQADERQQKADEESHDIKEYRRETDRIIRELGRQIGGLGNKFGSFTESLALPSAERLLREHFGVEAFTAYLRRTRNGNHIEVDGFGFNNGERNEGYIVEVKSKLDDRSIEQTLSIMERFRSFFPEFADKTLYAILAVAEATNNDALQRAFASGLYVIRFHDDLMEFLEPENFIARAF